jgi:LacI family transcriptional regulator
MATIRDVSQLAKVSQATVSRVLNGTVPVSHAKRTAVLAAIEQLGYHPNAFARSLATNRSFAIGAMVSELSSAVYGDIIRGIESVVEARGMHIMVSSGHARSDLERKALEALKERRTDALIVQVDASPDDELVTWVRQAGLPVIVVGRCIPAIAECCVHLDNVAGGALATRHLADRGHRRIAHVAGLMRLADARDRLAGYQQALGHAGLDSEPSLIVEGGFVEDGGYRAIQQLLIDGTDFTAIFAANDQSAAGALKALREAGLRVPDDVSLVGFDDLFIAHYLYPALTTVRQPFTEMGQAAARLALAALGIDTEREVTRRFDPVLVERDSVATL